MEHNKKYGLTAVTPNAPAVIKESCQANFETELVRLMMQSSQCRSIRGANRYFLEKEILTANNPLKESFIDILINRLIDWLRGELEDDMGESSSQFTNFKVLSGEKVSNDVDKLNGSVQKIGSTSPWSTSEAKLAKWKEELETPELKQLWISIALLDDSTFAIIWQNHGEIVTT